MERRLAAILAADVVGPDGRGGYAHAPDVPPFGNLKEGKGQ